ncbi:MULTISPECIES: alkaline phosphatase family protein [Microbacterium]|uniref:alkaline phosphatase family protein n=1 Tax=Microbacterium TaxID=33882 RepID=UPI00217DEA91|nr:MULTISPECIES: nucleotide pyrophosphatase/phosphodiesterase family protein [Microbacterium]UWF76493.1 alkaline phosphatase family protein [Microbacterium neungamense]WCM54644.1 alkaline phosphatase family protein [Microbacterium sp. EF45047]
MSLMLPSSPAATRNIAGVAPELLRALRGEAESLPAVRSAVLVVVDGLGALPLRAHAGHARHLTAGMSKRDVAAAVFPTTTAAALTSILTGAAPGEHGLVGYRVRDPRRDVLVNQLSDWEDAGIDPFAWQPVPTVFERAVAAGHQAFAVGIPAYATSGFTRATLRGASFVPEKKPADRVAAAWELAAAHPGALVYCYLPEVDKAGHKHGIASAEWVRALEDVDAALGLRMPDGVGVAITADHGMIDVPAHRQLVLEDGEGWHDGVRHIGGEPRMLHVYLEPEADAAAVALRWRSGLEGAADVVTRDEAVRAGLFGAVVSAAAVERLGDLLVVARGNRALYDGADADQRGRNMVGQHGGLTDEEWRVPLLLRGAFEG